MKAAALTSFGGPEVLELMDVAEPRAGEGQVRIRVRAAGVQHFDTGIRQGWAPPSVDLSFPVIPGNEFAGIVDEVGDGVAGVEVGAEVLGYSTLGSYAEHLVVPPDQFVPKPKSMPWEIAGGFTGAGQGAHMALQAMQVRPGDTVLISGAAGAFGTFSVQLALAWGAKRVIGTASEANHDYLRGLGAVPVTYGEGLVERVRAVAPDGVDAALDAAGPEALYASAELVEDRNRIRTMVSDEAAEELGIPALGPARSRDRLVELTGLYEQGKLDGLHLRATYPLERAGDAHRLIETGHGRGKIVLTLA
ncbi:NADPH:quinone reductase-like Zn-dependent oxidoreductase [Krasilnikovia cinnamomea]|uniref:NADPH:quinone reductase-like Zn-dependent oxidoreductase n=1 Tax=Krasilnikovia cinnamomea TaxID=349313 RepID=A0A4Q7ZMJ7_9ACTN|nr:NADP-dependent oxidoreductase [Krasilnikovia cinnamomea]RZU51643.1 NADPH:quinone reductase-like Zn-dependent oxidoreductase [Krasilnikovia cinnamomea]